MLPLVTTRREISTGQLPSAWRASNSPPTVSPMSWDSSDNSVMPSSATNAAAMSAWRASV